MATTATIVIRRFIKSLLMMTWTRDNGVFFRARFRKAPAGFVHARRDTE
jgi:hypothetical protein